ncbi:type 1 glutamine amidotransferase domain-containing protein [Vibrio algarum]|uniref:Type 1 glutamine amidotransferase domain-containing protein n=1 Tax=Vibrio algarum TaxID=3020714 RepID=A0ABT4YXX4_9VIBR|nr:type 1 glutamine amidotransferase domain-containing protein [Vibrio sp. KJ40-1]MDB1125833.1 type 1 glutamine amidotransferase domain-containing protein [Vibrio sp. KJ40-1]
MVLTSHSELGNTGKKTGFWVEEFASPYYAFLDAGIKVTLASPAGGQPPIDPSSELEDFQTAATKRFDEDKAGQLQLANTLKLEEMNESEFDAVFYPGGHGPLWDLVEDSNSVSLVESFLANNKPVAAVCHATAVLLNVKDAEGEYVVNSKAVTGFSNTEEEAVQLTEVVPFLLEDELKNRGADYQKVSDWTPFVVQDGLLVTGQNPASSESAAEKLLGML